LKCSFCGKELPYVKESELRDIDDVMNFRNGKQRCPNCLMIVPRELDLFNPRDAEIGDSKNQKTSRSLF
jgi:hypothetical protein